MNWSGTVSRTVNIARLFATCIVFGEEKWVIDPTLRDIGRALHLPVGLCDDDVIHHSLSRGYVKQTDRLTDRREVDRYDDRLIGT